MRLISPIIITIYLPNVVTEIYSNNNKMHHMEDMKIKESFSIYGTSPKDLRHEVVFAIKQV